MEIFAIIAVIFSILRSVESSDGNSTVNCTEYRDMFAIYASKFTTCAISNSRPITLCESCVDVYINVTESYKNMYKFSDGDGPCITNYIDLDRLQILETLYKSSFDLWNRAKCYECFEVVDGRLTHNRSEKTIKFDKLLNETINCIEMNNKTSFNVSSMCDICINKYLELNDYYYKIIDENDKIAGCMDVVDLMNGTRSYWSKTCCQYRRKPEIPFLISTASMFIVTILFYATAKMCTDKKSPVIYQQSRFAESLNTNSS